MSYRMRLDEPVGEAVRAVVREQLEDAAARLDHDYDDDPVTAVHEARKAIKKTRSALRLVRPGVPGKAYRRENRELRDIARSISGARDADVMVETVDALAERYAGRLPKRSFTALRKRFASASHSDADATSTSIPDVVDSLRGAAMDTADWPVDRADPDTLRRGAARAYARGRTAFAVARKDPTTETLHEWRKRVKDLWYHQRLLRDAWGGVLKAQAKASHELADLLGDDHDLAVLADALRAEDGPARSAPVDEDPVFDLLAERRAELRHAAFALGRRVYAEKPKAYRRRLGRYLRAADAGRPLTASA